MGENICKWSHWLGLISKCTVHGAQYRKKTSKKMGGRSKYTFLQKRYTVGQEAHEKMLNITIS